MLNSGIVINLVNDEFGWNKSNETLPEDQTPGAWEAEEALY